MSYDNWRPRLASNTTDVRQLTTPASHQHHWRPRLATSNIDAAGQQSPSPRPDVTDSESDSDDELYVLTPQNPARATVVVPVMCNLWFHLCLCLDARDVWQRRTLFDSNPTAKLPGAVPVSVLKLAVLLTWHVCDDCILNCSWFLCQMPFVLLSSWYVFILAIL